MIYVFLTAIVLLLILLVWTVANVGAVLIGIYEEIKQ